MFTQNHLSLRLVRLKAADTWDEHGSVLCFVFPIGGTGKFVSDRVSQRLAPGEVLVFDGEVGGKLCAPERGEFSFRCFSACMEHLYPLFATAEISVLQDVLAQLKPLKLHPASSPVAKECQHYLKDVSPQFNLDHRSQVLRLAAMILAPEFNTVRTRRSGFVRVEDHMVQVFERLSTAELLHMSVGELADKFGCSRRHLNRLFHQYFGVSVATLRMEMRLSKAVSLLRDPDSKVIRVAEDCGFNHLGLFNSCFKRRFGVSPGQWRKRAQPGKTDGGEMLGGEAICPMRINGLCPWDGRSEGMTGLGHSTGTAKGAGGVKQELAARVEMDLRAIRQTGSGASSLQVAS